MIDDVLVKRIKVEIVKNEDKLQKQVMKIKQIWEETGLDPKDPSYLIEKTMRFEMAHAAINSVFLLFNETITEYKRLCSELEKHSDLQS